MPTALVVADSEWVINDIRSSLAISDWEIVPLSESRRAAETVAERVFDVVIVDMQVGSMGGMAIIRAIRAEFQDSTPPRLVLMLDRSADRFLARRALADASVIKPFGAAELRAVVDPAPRESSPNPVSSRIADPGPETDTREEE